jgi:hypothetical protein
MGDETPGWNEESALRWAPDRRHAFNASAAPLETIRTGPWSPRPELPREEPVVTAPTVIQAWPWRIAIGAA